MEEAQGVVGSAGPGPPHGGPSLPSWKFLLLKPLLLYISRETFNTLAAFTVQYTSTCEDSIDVLGQQ